MKKNLLHLSCPSCGVEPGAIDIQQVKGKTIKCPVCQAEFYLSGKLVGGDDLSYKEVLETPVGIREVNHITSLEIILGVWSKRKLSSLASALFLLFVFIYKSGLDEKIDSFRVDDYSTWFSLGVSVILLLSLGLPFLIKNRILLDKQWIEVVIFPRNLFLTNKKYNVNDVEQIFVEERKKRRKRNRRGKVFFDVKIKMKGEEQAQRLIKNLISPEHAYYIENKIEQYLQIKDSKIEGAYDIRNGRPASSGGRYAKMKDIMRDNFNKEIKT